MAYRGGGREHGRRGRYSEEWLDVVFELLAEARRRFVLSYLRDRRRTTFEELTDVVTGWEQARRGNAIATSVERDRVAASGWQARALDGEDERTRRRRRR